jgi:hypothetical protein
MVFQSRLGWTLNSADLQLIPFSDLFRIGSVTLVGEVPPCDCVGEVDCDCVEPPPPPPPPPPPLPPLDCGDITLQAQLMEPFTLYQAVMPMVVVEYDIMGEWPIPLSSVITPPTGVYTAGFETHDPFHIDATMKTEAEGVASCFAGEIIHFVFDPSARTWGCNTDIPAEYMTLFPMTCD